MMMLSNQVIGLFCLATAVASKGLLKIPAPLSVLDPFCIRVLPLPLSIVNPTFSVFTSDKHDQFMLSSLQNVQASVDHLADTGFFKKGRQVIFIMEGYFGNFVCPVWLDDMKNAILEVESDSTVFLVEWSLGADNPDYGISASTTQTVSTAISAVAEAVAKTAVFNDSPTDLYLHCIGHSLGAHICGQAGRKARSANGQQLFNRVTGLDPASPGFETCTDHFNIDTDSAICVDNIHTDGNLNGHLTPIIYWGTLKAWGDIDFYPNGGVNQPACAGLSLENDAACSHLTALEYYLLSVRNKDACMAVGPCGNPVNPSSCSNQTQPMGHFSSCHRGSQMLAGKYYINLGAQSQCTVQNGIIYCFNNGNISI